MKLILNIALFVNLFVSVTANAETPLATQALLAQLKNIKTLQADFIQENYDAKNKLLQKQTGNFKVTDNGEFIWNIAAPYEQKIISDGKVLKIFDPDLEQLTIKPLDKKAQVIPLLLFSGESEAITQQYEISSSAQDSFDLHARDKNSLFEKLQVRFKNNKPVSLSIIDSVNQKTLVSFDKVIANQALKPSLFQFDAPAGTDVIDER
jgi:outer membrane lipoprotein carrier protein